MQDDSAEATEIEKDICIDCGTGIDKSAIVQTVFGIFQPVSLCPSCSEVWRWRQQICVRTRPYRLPLWRPKKLTPDGFHGTRG